MKINVGNTKGLKEFNLCINKYYKKSIEFMLNTKKSNKGKCINNIKNRKEAWYVGKLMPHWVKSPLGAQRLAKELGGFEDNKQNHINTLPRVVREDLHLATTICPFIISEIYNVWGRQLQSIKWFNDVETALKEEIDGKIYEFRYTGFCGGMEYDWIFIEKFLKEALDIECMCPNAVKRNMEINRECSGVMVSDTHIILVENPVITNLAQDGKITIEYADGFIVNTSLTR